jgi:hypothetical protein
MRYGPKVKKSIDRDIEPTDGLGGISSFTPAACSDTPRPPRQLGPRSLFQSAHRGDARSSAVCQDHLGPLDWARGRRDTSIDVNEECSSDVGLEHHRNEASRPRRLFRNL